MLRWNGRMPGYNGQYSPVQVRSLLENGMLGMPDYPLMFLIHAGVARVVHTVTGLSRETSTMIAVKLCVALLPPLIGFPIFILCRGLCVRAGRGESRIPALAALIATLGSPFMIMTGHLDKNALAIVWLSAMLAALHVFMDRRSIAPLVLTVLFLGLLGLTHVATFGSGLLIVCCVLAMHLFLPGAPPLRQSAPFIVAMLVTVALTQALVFWKFDPVRIGRLAGAAVNPLHFVTSDDAVVQGTLVAPDAPSLAVALTKTVVLAVASAWVFRTLRHQRALVSRVDTAIIAGCMLGVVFLTGPWVRNDSAPRLALIACVPALLVGVFALMHVTRRGVLRFVAACCILFIIGPGILQCARGGWRILSDEAYAELEAAAPRIASPEKTLVVAMHGTEWDAAWLLRTNVAHLSALRTEDWQRYDQVLYLTATGRMQPLSIFGRMGGFGKVQTEKDNRRILEVGSFARIPFIDIPPGAEPVLNGQSIVLARVKSPPPDVRADSPSH